MYHNQPFTTLILILATASLLCAATQEDKLAQRVIQTNRAVVGRVASPGSLSWVTK